MARRGWCGGLIRPTPALSVIARRRRDKPVLGIVELIVLLSTALARRRAHAAGCRRQCGDRALRQILSEVRTG